MGDPLLLSSRPSNSRLVPAMTDEQEQESPADWVPDFPGQRPPFEPGNKIGRQFEPGNLMSPTTHGAYSPRKVDPLAQELVDALLVDDTVPVYAKASAYRAELWAWARAEAQAQLVTEWLIEAGESAANGVGDLSSQAVHTAYLLLHRAEGRAASARTRLGLTPVSAARLGKDVAVGHAASVDVAQRMALLADAEARVEERLRKQGWVPPEALNSSAGAADEETESGPS